MTEIKIPDIGDFDAVEVIEILVAVGDTVSAEEPLLTLESDKATMDIPSPGAGTVSKILVSLGDKVAEGTLVMELETGSSPVTTPEPEVKKQDSSTPIQNQKQNPEPVEPSISTTLSSHSASDEAPSTPKAIPAAPEPARDPSGILPHASPAVRRFSRELGASLGKIAGTGPKGRILKEDVKSWVKTQLSEISTHKQTSGSGIPALPEIDFSEFGEIESLKLSRIKRLSGPHLQRAWLNIPHVTHHDEADITDLEAFRKSLKKEAEAEGLRVTILSFIMKVLVSALKKFPNFNASLAPNGEELILKKYFNIGIAVDTPNGLIVPVVKDVDRKSIFDLARDLADISARAREGKLKPEDLKGGCISISSLGGIGGAGFTPIINAPEVAILGVSKAKMTPVWNGESFSPRLLLPLDLSYDHRVVDGAEAARFVAFLTQSFSDVRRLSL
jgi:pyruvate dehydrogenase E2 component (dihydrolipoamide acetyltransferase)